MKKENVPLDFWAKEIAPSTELRKWFNHQPELFPEFKRKYKEELKEKKMELNHLKSIAAKKNLTLLYSAKDTQFNQAVVLLDALNK